MLLTNYFTDIFSKWIYWHFQKNLTHLLIILLFKVVNASINLFLLKVAFSLIIHFNISQSIVFFYQTKEALIWRKD